MNVVIVNTFDTKGGAARAAYRLHKGLNQIGIHSFMLVKEKKSQDKTVFQIDPLLDDDAEKELKIIDRITREYVFRNRTDLSNAPFSPGYPGYALENTKLVEQADLVNLHWVAKYQSTESISSLLRTDKPVVWTLHDENPFTGGCHYSAGCRLYKKNCKTCPQLRDDPYNLSYHNLQNKITHFRDKNITIVCPSKWMAKAAKQSKVFRDFPVVTIPNSIETDVFIPQNKCTMKKKLGIPGDHVTILTGISGWLPKRKGFAEFLALMGRCLENKKFKNMVDNKKLLLLCFGTPAAEIKDLNIPYRSFGDIDSDFQLCDIYNAADIFVLPSIEDNFPNTILEAMACQTPVIAFNTGGIPDIIKDGITGRLVPFKKVKKFAKVMLDLIFDHEQRESIGKRARQLIEKKYQLQDQARGYAQLFSQLLPGGFSTSNKITPQGNQQCPPDFSFNSRLSGLYKKYAEKIK